ncbi:MAG: di-trans,poly-cis-decaprenylcistransferase [Flavobacteriaceae bacterium]|nr:di-trans,poly-cis-decaprenylcistransferase [Flavobacteriaceae bacterium]|tara:strand:- start:6 stop:743 length:738 start_codon:yes stop_codon:yes gene_type:complete
MSFDEFSADEMPKHVAIIMDGNGRWAKQQGKNRLEGHESGAIAVRRTVEAAAKLGIKHLTLYAFSTENWKRPKVEVSTLMTLLVRNLRRELERMTKNNIRLSAIGSLSKLPNKVRHELQEVIEKTQSNTGTNLTLALSYGAREEIKQAVIDISKKVKNSIINVESIDETIINEHLYTQNLPDVDLLIRTSGEVRISNFLLWQIAYAELYFTDVMWPEFDEHELNRAIKSYLKRERRFGKTSEQLT